MKAYEVKGMDNNPNKRLEIIDILKGIGILSIVIGHACWETTIFNVLLPIGAFVYLYHLSIFFFCSGYCYHGVREMGLSHYIGKRISSLYIPFIKYAILFLVLHNFFINIGIQEAEKYTLNEYIIKATDIFLFNTSEQLLSTFWFLPTMFFALILYGLIDFWDQRIFAHSQTLFKYIAIFLFGLIGIYSTAHQFGLLYNLQISYLMLPIIAIGELVQKKDLLKRHNSLFCITALPVSFGYLCWVLHQNIGIIELSKFQIISPIMFYPVTLMGIIFCYSLAYLIKKGVFLRRLFIYIGKNSFSIMALHFLIFKTIDLVYSNIIGLSGNLGMFPYSYPQLGVVYVLLGVFLPILFISLGKAGVKVIYELYQKILFKCI